MYLGLSITALWALRMTAVAAVVFFVFAVLPVLVLRNRPHRTWFQRTLLSVNVSMVVVALTAASVLTWFEDQFSDIPRQEFGEGVLAETEDEGEPRNILLVGIDASEGIDESNPINIGRNPTSLLADTIMVLRVDPDTDEAHIISFPRDLWLPLDGRNGNGKINEALQSGGAEALVNTITSNFGIDIHHYVQVNFLGFQELVGILDGVPMFFPYSVRASSTGLDIQVDEGGECVTVGPDMALAFVRARTDYQELVDGEWELDATGDLGRNRRQQLFVQLALAQAVDKGARNPTTMSQFLELGQNHVRLDEDMTLGDLQDLGEQFSDIDPTRMVRHQLPVTGGTVGAASVVFLNEDEAAAELSAFRGLSDELVTTAAVRVNVRNGSGVTGQAVEVQDDLVAAGFTVPSALPADAYDYQQTIIRYTPGNQLLAAFLARFLPENPVIEEVESLGDANLELVTGLDFGGIVDEPRSEAAVATLTPRTTAPADTTTSTTGSTTTTTMGRIPEQPPDRPC
jgi:LCP family protein required for cell wall assembly